MSLLWITAASDGRREEWKPGDRAHYEYHCFESPESTDAELWYRSHKPVTVVGRDEQNEAWGPAWHGSTIDERASEGMPRTYRVRFDDGHEGSAWEDELLTHPKHFYRPDPPERD